MKGDFSRNTFVPQRHYRGVLMQQGRVQVDADWNEQQAIQQRLDETTTRDVVGLCGVPEDTVDGFKLTANGSTLDIGQGRIYVDGILCENDRAGATYSKQPHRLTPASLLDDMAQARGVFLLADLARDQLGGLTPEQRNQVPNRFGLVYLDVWERAVSALDDAHIREKALNGPDTTTRRQTVWQLRVKPFPAIELPAGQRAQVVDMLVEIGQTAGQIVRGAPTGRDLLDLLLSPQADAADACRGGWPGWGDVVAGSTGRMMAKAEAPQGDDNNPCLVPAGGGFRRLENQLYRVEVHQGGNETRATFKWSRENGSVAVRWVGQSGANGEILEIEGPNPDAVLGFSAGQWVELTDDVDELEGRHGLLLRLGPPDGARLTIDTTSLPTGMTKAPKHTPETNPKIRRWDTGALGEPAKPERNLSIAKVHDLEDGIQVQFRAGTYRTGDYWLIPARTTGGQIEWPGWRDGEVFWPPYPAGVEPAFETPAGVPHHYCPLAVVYLDVADRVHVVDDCRQIFPPLTGLVALHYAGGDGQTARVDPSGPDLFLPLDLPLRVQVLGSTDPIEGAEVRFRALERSDLRGSAGDLSATQPALPADITLTTGPDGVAAAFWKLFDGDPVQRVEASLVSVPGDQRLIPRAILFHAQLGEAAEIAYHPTAACATLQVNTVQDALDRLATLAHLVDIGGTGQVGVLLPNQGAAHIPLTRPLQVQVVSSCGPLEGATVSFVAAGNGRLSPTEAFPANAGNSLEVTTQANGVAQCFWQVSTSDADGPQFVTAQLTAVPGAITVTQPLTVEFNASVVRVTEGGGGGCCVSVTPDQLSEVIQQLVNAGQVNIEACLQPVQDGSVKFLELDGSDMHYSLTVRGCGKAIPVAWQVWSLSNLRLFRLQDASVRVAEVLAFKFTNCEEVVIEGCRLVNRPASSEPIISINEGNLVHLRKNVFLAPGRQDPIPPRDIFDGLTAVAVGDSFIGPRGQRRTPRLAASQGLFAISTAEKRQLAAGLKRRVDQARDRLTPAEIAAYTALQGLLTATTFQPGIANYERSLAAIDRAAAQAVEGAGRAISLSCAGAQVYIVDNLIAGALFLYGGASEVFLTGDHHQLVSRGLKNGQVVFSPDDGELHLRGNDLYALDGAGFHARRLLEIAGNGGQIEGIFSAVFLAENRLYAGAQTNIVPLALAGHVALTGNSFDADGGNQGGSVIANSASYTGNMATPAIAQEQPVPSVQIVDASMVNLRGPNQAANPGVQINPM